EDDAHRDAPAPEQPRGDQPVAAVVPGSADDGDAPLRQVRVRAREGFDERHAGMFHQDETGEAVAADRAGIDASHLDSRENFHQLSGIVVQRAACTTIRSAMALRLLTSGESHGPSLLVVLDGLPAGLRVSAAA